ncbi:MAG TPA: MBOAT family O-acyltransferase, partial [Chitinophagales bacterium]
MVFSSIIFLFYFLPIFFLCYFLAPRKWKNPLILVGSIFFYAWGAPRFIFVILGTTVIDFILVRKMDSLTDKRAKKLLLALSCSMNLGLLFYFKYCNFFIENINHFLGLFDVKPIHWLELVLPIGISFYTFETLTYVVDVYRGIHKPLKNFWDYQLYIILFPKLIAGPIVRYHDIADQIYDRSAYENSEFRLRGFYRFTIGLAKKVIIANTMAVAADTVFGANINSLGTTHAWLGALAYTFQIYFDFSGYSDMAIGLALMMGFRIPENFDNPYISKSITEFWRRWHISLGNWMRNYLYIPLGGNKNGKIRTYFNLWFVFLASGLWHGAAWGFVIWGAYHGLFLVIERAFLSKVLSKLKWLSLLYSFPIVLIGWVFFRIEHLRPSLQFLSRMFQWNFAKDNLQFGTDFYTMLVLAIFFAFITIFSFGKKIEQKFFFERFSLRKHFVVVSFFVILL